MHPYITRMIYSLSAFLAVIDLTLCVIAFG